MLAKFAALFALTQSCCHALTTVDGHVLSSLEENSHRKKIEYGTYTVPSRSKHDGMLEIYDTADPPCSDCAITSMQAHLEYENGTTADASSGMWMHHVVFENVNNVDGVCGEEREGQRFFASGNERTTFDLTNGGKQNVGYFVAKDDKFRFYGELMNMHDESQDDVVMSVTWTYVESPHETDIQSATPYWLDIGGCGSSDRPAANDSLFTYSSPPVRSPFHGRIVIIGSHLHDGGSKLEVLGNGKPVCSVEPSYTGSHISSIPVCSDVGSVALDEEWVLTAHYDTRKYMPMVNGDGSLEPIMGIALAYVVKKDSKAGGHGSKWIIWLPVVIVVCLLGVGATYWFRRRTRAWPKWMAGRQYRAMDGERDEYVEDE